MRTRRRSGARRTASKRKRCRNTRKTLAARKAAVASPRSQAPRGFSGPALLRVPAIARANKRARAVTAERAIAWPASKITDSAPWLSVSAQTAVAHARTSKLKRNSQPRRVATLLHQSVCSIVWAPSRFLMAPTSIQSPSPAATSPEAEGCSKTASAPASASNTAPNRTRPMLSERGIFKRGSACAACRELDCLDEMGKGCMQRGVHLGPEVDRCRATPPSPSEVVDDAARFGAASGRARRSLARVAEGCADATTRSDASDPRGLRAPRPPISPRASV